MADFMYLFRGPRPADDLSPEQMQKHMQRWVDWIQDLTKSGNFKAGDPLDHGGKVIQPEGKSVTDGPFAEAKDVVGGYLVVAAETLDDASQLAKACPILEDGGTVEVRPIAKM